MVRHFGSLNMIQFIESPLLCHSQLSTMEWGHVHTANTIMEFDSHDTMTVIQGFNDAMRDEFAFDLVSSRLESSRRQFPHIVLLDNPWSRIASLFYSDVGFGLFDEPFPVKRDRLSSHSCSVYDLVANCDRWVDDSRVMRYLREDSLEGLAVSIGCFFGAVLGGVFPCISRHPLRKSCVTIDFSMFAGHPMFVEYSVIK